MCVCMCVYICIYVYIHMTICSIYIYEKCNIISISVYDLDLWGLHWHLKNTQSVREIQGRLKRPCDKDPTFMTHATTKDEKQLCVCVCACVPAGMGTTKWSPLCVKCGGKDRSDRQC